MNGHFHDLKSQMKSMQDTMRKKLTRLSIDSDNSIKTLQKKEEMVKAS